jgi:hypothetical protein
MIKNKEFKVTEKRGYIGSKYYFFIRQKLAIFLKNHTHAKKTMVGDLNLK